MGKFLNIKASLLILFTVIIDAGAFKVEDSLNQIAQEMRSGIFQTNYDVHTLDTNQGVDTIKINFGIPQPFGIFHNGNPNTHYSQLYYTEVKGIENISHLSSTSKLSERGSQGTSFIVPEGGIIIAYELENHQNGNTLAIRYYESQQKLQINNFLYEYQLNQIVSEKNVRNVGTPSIEGIKLMKQNNLTKFNEYSLQVKFHYSPDGSHDFPGYGFVNLKPLRDFVDSQGNWKGGVKQKYGDWSGYEDQLALGVLRSFGCAGKIGQRDYFKLNSEKYYLYECNINPEFNWKDWRIFLYSPTQKKAVDFGINLDGDIDIANPHISLLKQENNTYSFVMTFFLPSEGTPGTNAKAGQVIIATKLNL